MFPDALNYFSFVVALLCAVPLVIGLYQYIGYVSGIFYRCNGTVSRIEQKLKAIEDMVHNEGKASRLPPPHLYDRIQVFKVDFNDLRGQSESIRFRQSPLRFASAICHILRGDAVVCRLLRVEEALGTLLDQWKEMSDLAIMMNYGGHLAKPFSTVAEVEIDIQATSLPALEITNSVSGVVSMGTLSRPIDQQVQCSEVDNDSDLESTSGSEAGATSTPESQVDTDREVLRPLPTRPPRVKSVGSRRALQRKISALNAQGQAEDDRAYLTMYTSNTTIPACRGEGSAAPYPPDPHQLRRSHAGRIHARPSVVTEA